MHTRTVCVLNRKYTITVSTDYVRTPNMSRLQLRPRINFFTY